MIRDLIVNRKSYWKLGLLIAPFIIAAAVFVFVQTSPPATGPDSAICSLSQTGQAPSGRTLGLCQILNEVQPSGDVWAIVRVTDPDLPDISDQRDHDWACATWGLPALGTTPRPTRIVVQIMAAPFERGEAAPGITQSIEAYSEADGACEWELL
jgi:hypothetical protein